MSVFGKYQPVDLDKVAQLGDEDRQLVESLQATEKKRTLAKVAILPCIMFACYMVLIYYFKSRGGYQAVALDGHE